MGLLFSATNRAGADVVPQKKASDTLGVVEDQAKASSPRLFHGSPKPDRFSVHLGFHHHERLLSFSLSEVGGLVSPEPIFSTSTEQRASWIHGSSRPFHVLAI